MDCEKVKISVIIPVYNCQQYLEQCIDSVINQTLKEIEIVCVDDGSSDGSYDILHRYAKKYKHINIFKQINKGAGAARNLGLKNAIGEFVAFLDADDYYLDADALEKMYTTCKQNEVSLCGSYGKIIEGDKFREANFYDSSKMIPGVVYNYADFQIDCGFTTFIYEKKLLDEKNIQFPLYRRFEDPPFMVEALYWGSVFVMADTFLYCYRAPNLVSRFTQDNIIDMLKGLQNNIIFSMENNLKTLFLTTLNRIERDYVYMILCNLSTDSSEKNNVIFLHLLDINELVQLYLNDKTYILQPLKMMMTRAAAFVDNYEKHLNEKIDGLNHIAIYGAGKYAKNFLNYLRGKKKLHKVKYIVVSSRKDNEEEIGEIPVIDIDTFVNEKENICIFVAVSGMYHQEILDVLKQKKYTNYELMDDAFLGRIG